MFLTINVVGFDLNLGTLCFIQRLVGRCSRFSRRGNGEQLDAVGELTSAGYGVE